MVKLLLMLCVLMVIAAAWMIALKMYKTQKFIQKRNQYQAPAKRASVTEAEPEKRGEEPVQLADAYEQQLFDDIAALLMTADLHDRQYKFAEAEQLQADVFRKMPVCSKTQIRQLDLEEWSIYWTFYEQSLEYYVGKYGVFYTHVDRFGAEHKYEPVLSIPLAERLSVGPLSKVI